MPETTKRPEEQSDFASFLASQRPKTNNELGEELRKLVGKVRDTGKAGTITLAVTVKPVDGDPSVLSVTDAVKVKLPEHTRLGSIAFADRHNNLSKSDPNSMPLFEDDDIRDTAPDHDPATGEIKDTPSA